MSQEQEAIPPVVKAGIVLGSWLGGDVLRFMTSDFMGAFLGNAMHIVGITYGLINIYQFVEKRYKSWQQSRQNAQEEEQ